MIMLAQSTKYGGWGVVPITLSLGFRAQSTTAGLMGCPRPWVREGLFVLEGAGSMPAMSNSGVSFHSLHSLLVKVHCVPFRDEGI